MTSEEPHISLVFGVRIAFPVQSRLLPAATDGPPADVEVRFGAVPERLGDAVRSWTIAEMEARCELGRREEVLWTSRSARYLIEDGRTVTVEPGVARTPWPPIQRFILYYCVPAVLVQRGQVALHASTVVVAGGAVVIAGESGSGKSTLLSALIQSGCAMLSDDVTALSMGADGVTAVAPGLPQYRLCADSLARIKPLAAWIRPVGGGRGKHAVRVPPDAFETESRPLRAIFLLEAGEGNSVAVEPILGVAKMSAVCNHGYAPLSLGDYPRQTTPVAACLARVPVLRLRRPRGAWSLDELVAIVKSEAALTRS